MYKNRYPGAACDVPAHLYSFSFELRADWPQKYASQAEILKYLVHCAQKYGLNPHIRFGAEVTDARWDETSNHWIVRTADGQVFQTQALVTATGQLSRPSYPQLPGASFGGPLFHSAEWQDCDFRGKRVAVIGTGASAIQLVPAIAPLVSKLYVFQRSAAYVLPKSDKFYSPRQIRRFKKMPAALWLNRMLIYLQHEQRAFGFVTWRAAMRIKRRAFFRHLRRGVKNMELRERLIPDYRFGCKRILLSNDFYPAMDRANVELVTEHLEEIRRDAIVAGDAVERKVDCIIFATGFAATDFLVPIYRSVWTGLASVLEGRGRSVSRHHRHGLSQFFHALRSQHQSRAQFDRLHDREPDSLCHGLRRPARRRRRSRYRREEKHSAALQ